MPDYTIPSAERARGEPAGVLPLRQAEDQEAAETAPGLLDEYRNRRGTLLPGGTTRMVMTPSGDLVRQTDEDRYRAPLRQHFRAALRAGRWLAFGFSESRRRRELIKSPGRNGISYDDDGGAVTVTGEHYSDVVFCRDTKAKPQGDKPRVAAKVKAFLETETAKEQPQATKKIEWERIVLKVFQRDGVTSNMFKQAWRVAKIPEALKTQGRRSSGAAKKPSKRSTESKS